MSTISARGIGHSPKGAVPILLGVVGLGLVIHSFLYPEIYDSAMGENAFLYGLTTMSILRLFSDATDESR
jgi:hypothetical protein